MPSKKKQTKKQRGRMAEMKRGIKYYNSTAPSRARVFSSQEGLQNPAVMTNFPVSITDEWRYETRLSSGVGGEFSAFVSLRNPLAAFNGSGTYARATGFANLYDEYKVLDVTVILTPVFPSIVPAGHVGIAVDYDSIPSGTYTYGDLRDSEYLRDYRGMNQIAYTSREAPLSEGTYRERPAIIHKPGWYDFNTPPEEGFIAIVGEDFAPSSALYRVLITLRVKMRRRRTINITRDQRLQSDPEANVAAPNQQFLQHIAPNLPVRVVQQFKTQLHKT